MLTSGFFNSLGHDRLYDAEQMSSIFDGVIADGIFATVGNSMVVNKDPNSDRGINIGTGRAWFNHTWTLNDTLYQLVIEESSPVLNRIDAVVLEVNRDTEVRENTFKIVKGEYSNTDPVKPTLIHDEFINQYALAYITVNANTNTVSESDITNAVGTTETPFVTGVIDTIDISELLAKYDNDIKDLQDEKAAQFREWFSHLQNELDSNQAANLQRQIDSITDTIRTVPMETIDAMFEGTYVQGLYLVKDGAIIDSENFKMTTDSRSSSRQTLNRLDIDDTDNAWTCTTERAFYVDLTKYKTLVIDVVGLELTDYARFGITVTNEFKESNDNWNNILNILDGANPILANDSGISVPTKTYTLDITDITDMKFVTLWISTGTNTVPYTADCNNNLNGAGSVTIKNVILK